MLIFTEIRRGLTLRNLNFLFINLLIVFFFLFIVNLMLKMS